MAIKNYRSRMHTLLLYEESESYNFKEVMELIKQWNYCYIKHDKDTDEDGVLKKTHYHVIIKTSNATWASAITKDLGITQNYIEQVRNSDSMLDYLVHYNDDTKYPYEIDEVKGPMKQDVIKAINKDGKDEGVKVLEILDFMDSQDRFIKYSELIRWCALQGYYSDLRRGGSLLCNVLNEHNDKYRKKEEEK